ncbi:MAG: hypothetical protein JWQ44_2530 [Chthoniobacter sp.]|nr:hypothetical protein [Chthoniobacter sp.]
MSKSAPRSHGKLGIEIVEDAVRLLRRAPGSVLLAHFVGSMPCMLYVLYFFTDLSHSPFAGERVFSSALTMAALYCWMKCWQSVSAAYLRAFVLQVSPPGWSAQRLLRLIAAQVLLQPAGLFLRFCALCLVLPYVWTATFFQTVTVLGDGEPAGPRALCAQSWGQARLWPIQAHGLAVYLTLFGFFILLNVGLTMFFLPQLAKMLLGLDTVFTQHAAGFANPTFFAAVFAATYLCLDPIRKAAVVLRCFHGSSLRTGEDLLVELQTLRRKLPRVAALTACILLGLGGGNADAEAPAPRVEAVELDRSIENVLERREFIWRGSNSKEIKEAEPSLLERMRTDFERWRKALLRKISAAIGKTWRQARDWMFGPTGDSSKPSDFLSWIGSVRFVIWALVVLCAIGLAVLIARRYRSRSVPVTAEALAPLPDLRDEGVTADQLPEDGWLQLARDLVQRGELRLALRASYLAGLAHLASRQLIGLARHKSNHDYDRELRRRARANAELLAAFDRNLSAFERTWYGTHAVTPETLGDFTQNLERIRAC